VRHRADEVGQGRPFQEIERVARRVVARGQQYRDQAGKGGGGPAGRPFGHVPERVHQADGGHGTHGVVARQPPIAVDGERLRPGSPGADPAPAPQHPPGGQASAQTPADAWPIPRKKRVRPSLLGLRQPFLEQAGRQHAQQPGRCVPDGLAARAQRRMLDQRVRHGGVERQHGRRRRGAPIVLLMPGPPPFGAGPCRRVHLVRQERQPSARAGPPRPPAAATTTARPGTARCDFARCAAWPWVKQALKLGCLSLKADRYAEGTSAPGT